MFSKEPRIYIYYSKHKIKRKINCTIVYFHNDIDVETANFLIHLQQKQKNAQTKVNRKNINIDRELQHSH